MRINILRARKIKKYSVILSEHELRQICRVLNEKAENLLAEENNNSEIFRQRLDKIIIKLTRYLNNGR